MLQIAFKCCRFTFKCCRLYLKCCCLSFDCCRLPFTCWLSFKCRRLPLKCELLSRYLNVVNYFYMLWTGFQMFRLSFEYRLSVNDELLIADYLLDVVIELWYHGEKARTKVRVTCTKQVLVLRWKKNIKPDKVRVKTSGHNKKLNSLQHHSDSFF